MRRMKKGKWSKEEDSLMKKHIEEYGIGRSWQALSDTLGLQRCGRSCRSRWLNYLRPGLKHGNFTPDEERIICEMYSKRGSCWSVIAAQLPGRTDLAVKNYWNSTLAKRFLPAPRSAAAAAAARRRHRPSSSTTSDATKPEELALVVYDYKEESATAGSSSGHAGVADTPVLEYGPRPPPVQVQVQERPQPPLATAGNVPKEEPIAAVPVSGPVRMIEQKPAVIAPPPPPPPGDQTGGLDIVCAPMSPIPLAFMEPDLPWIAGFDEIDSFLPWFDDC